MWNQYDAVLQNTSRTNNASEGWHNRFNILVGKNHPSLYVFLTALRKEQADTETMLQQLNLGQKIKRPASAKLKNIDNRISNIVHNFQDYVEEKNISEYLKIIGFNLKF